MDFKTSAGKSHQNPFRLYVLEGVLSGWIFRRVFGRRISVRHFAVWFIPRAFTPEFLGLLLASLYDHQVKTKLIPMGLIHNKAVFEQRGFINIAYTFREFVESREWMELALERVEENFLAQTTTDGVQREWSFGYHVGVLRDAVEIFGRMDTFGIEISGAFRERVQLMHDYIFWIASPDLGAPMFGDGSRALHETDDRSKWGLYDSLIVATELIGDPKYAARATLDREFLPEQKSRAFQEGRFVCDARRLGTRSDSHSAALFAACYFEPRSTG